MAAFDDIREPRNIDVLAAFSDLSRFAQVARERTDAEIFRILANYYDLVGDIVEDGGGRVLKFMGDAALMLFPAEGVDSGVQSLFRLREEGDAWLENQGFDSRHAMNAHFGPACCGFVGTKSMKHLDAFGDTINIATARPSHSLSITPQVFRKLSSDSRKAFKKHTPPISYIPTDERHK